ncbi:MAG: tetratricopeptide repeat protein, partial [Kiritimatiellae bacterium]|nr:tetratricopeptide repeat protein [Kiritimatiellia bacterium]
MKQIALAKMWAGPLGVGMAVMLLAGCGPRRAREHLDTGIARLREGNYAEAVRHFDAASAWLSDDASLHLNLGIALWKTGNTARAVHHLNKAADLTRNDPRPLEFLACVLMEGKDWNRARVALDRASHRVNASPRILTAMAALEWHAARPELARSLLTRALDVNPEYPPALYNLGVVYRDVHRDYTQAAEFFRRYLESIGQLETSERSSRDKHVETARQFLVHVRPASMTPKSGLPTNSRGSAGPPLSVASAPETPLQAARRLLTEGISAQRNGDLDRAISTYKQALAYDPHMAVAAYNLGLAYKSKGELDLARKAFLSALQDAPQMVDARYMLSLIHI